MIDHHLTNALYGDVNLVDAESPATGQIIYQLIRAHGLPFDRDDPGCVVRGAFDGHGLVSVPEHDRGDDADRGGSFG